MKSEDDRPVSSGFLWTMDYGLWSMVYAYSSSLNYVTATMRFFSRLVAICNICFIITVIMRYVEGSNAKQTGGELTRLPFIQNTLVVLGYSAIIMNFIFVLITIYLLLAKRLSRIPRLLLIFNLVVFAWQVIFHFDLF